MGVEDTLQDLVLAPVTGVIIYFSKVFRTMKTRKFRWSTCNIPGFRSCSRAEREERLGAGAGGPPRS